MIELCKEIQQIYIQQIQKIQKIFNKTNITPIRSKTLVIVTIPHRYLNLFQRKSSNKISDESIINNFNKIFKFILFRFNMFLFPFWSYFTSIASYFISGRNISKTASWSKRKVMWSWFVPKIRRFWTILSGMAMPSNGMAMPASFQRPTQVKIIGTTRACRGTAVPPLQTVFCCFCFLYKPPILVYFWPKAHGFLWNIILMYFLGIK